MSTQITFLEQLQEMATNKFQLLKPDKDNKGTFHLQLPFRNYTEVAHLIIDIVKVTMMALEAAEEDISDNKSQLCSIRGVLELIYHIMPLEEIEIIDNIHDLLKEQKKMPDNK